MYNSAAPPFVAPWNGNQEQDTVWRTVDTADDQCTLRPGERMHRMSMSLSNIQCP